MTCGCGQWRCPSTWVNAATGVARRLRCRVIGHNYRVLHGHLWCLDCLQPLQPGRSS